VTSQVRKQKNNQTKNRTTERQFKVFELGTGASLTPTTHQIISLSP
jgi:hypothetical protein